MAGVREEEFDEGDVWDVLQGDRHQAGSAEAAAALVATPTMNRRAGGKDKKDAVAKSDGVVMSSRLGRPRPSAPVAIPAGSGSSRRGGGEEDEEDGGEMLPPHEWLARKMERMGLSSPPDQACRGRSKGRELTKVRDAVLPKTAFYEQ
ncbi:uncharacterized protein C2845_PM03G08320 [Panicum miliaceum]|uniref:Uncharacterized protein n=1 Tax=Panicum miliaceum TaxID=4540 RepID=A0A3L6T7N0_PANMI|nr:uncharacterized protein C2845_PM03G08320 [Panicum miliaceum]